MKEIEIIKLGYTKEYLDHIRQQIPDLLEESIKRVKFMPFDTDKAYIAYKADGKATIILHHICKEAGIKAFSITKKEDTVPWQVSSLKTEINGMRRDKDHTKLINIRGSLKTIDHMPLYLEHGQSGRQYVYPIFDWSELQTMVCAMMLWEKFSAQCEARLSEHLASAVDALLAEEDRLWLEAAHKITAGVRPVNAPINQEVADKLKGE